MESKALKSQSCDEEDGEKGQRKHEREPSKKITKESLELEAETEKEERRRGRMLWLFVLNMAFVALFFLVLVIYNNVMLRTLERRFGLSSFQTGILTSSNDVMHICLVIFIAYFGDKGHRPRIIAFTLLFASLTGFLMASPHFLLHDYDKKVPSRRSNTTSWNVPLCYANHQNKTECSESDSDDGFFSYHPAFYIFLVAQFLSGIGFSALFTLSMAYIDENAPKNKLSLYIACCMCFFSLSPITAMLLAGFCLRLPENLLSEDNVNVDDPTFVGCWWLGFIIAAFLLIVFTIPLSFFPATLKRDIHLERKEELPLKKAVKKKNVSHSIKQQAREFPGGLKKLITNKLFILNLFQSISGAYILYGMYTNMVRYIETHFLYSATTAAIITGMTSSVLGAIGSLSGGFLISRFKFDTKQTLKFTISARVLYIAGVVVLLNIKCPQVQIDMAFTGNPFESTVENSCNEACNCNLERQSFYPVCGSNGISYYSPCLAGCSSSQNKTFTDCKCIRKLESNDSVYDFRTASRAVDFVEEGTATMGYCTPKCQMFITFTVVLVFLTFCSSITKVPDTMINFNIVDKKQRSFALGINSFTLNLLGFIPSPLLFGRLIDQSCILWQWTCNKSGACLLFDTARLRHSIYGTTLVVESLELCFIVAIFLLIPRRALHSPHEAIETEVFEKGSEEVQVQEKKDLDDLKAGLKDKANGKSERF